MNFKIISLGCKVNSYECAALKSAFLNHGYFEDKNNPDVVVINTCSVTATADQKSRQHIRKMMKTYPNAIVVVMGCYSQGNKDFIANEIKPHILIGTSHRHEIISLIEEYKINQKQIVKVDENPREFEYEEMGITSFSDNVRAYLKVQDGCNNFCSYCIIPYRRGKMRSRKLENIISEAKYLADKNYQEIVLTGIHVGGYGQDFHGVSFSDLVEKLLEIENLKGLRISSIEESEIDDKLINLYKESKVLAKHLHIPLQSGCDETLKRMNRKYLTKDFLEKIKYIKNLIPGVALTTDVIVGFPGETEEEFENTYKFIKECGFHMLHVFPFSPREGTPAWSMKNQVDPKVKTERVNRLLELSKTLWENYTTNFINQEIEVLIEKIKDGYCYARSSNYILVKFKQNNEKIGQKTTILLTKTLIQSE